MTKLKPLILGILLTIPLISSAEDFPWLTFTLSDDSVVSVASNQLSITYDNRMLLLKSATVDQQLSVDQIKSMRFTSTLTTSDLIADDVEPGFIEIYDLSGLSGRKFNTIEEAAIHFLPVSTS